MGAAPRNPSIDEPQPGDAALIAALRAKLEETIRLGNEQGVAVGSWTAPVTVREARALFAAATPALRTGEGEASRWLAELRQTADVWDAPGRARNASLADGLREAAGVLEAALAAAIARAVQLEQERATLAKIVSDIASSQVILGMIDGEAGHIESGTIDPEEATPPAERERAEEDASDAIAAAVGWYENERDRQRAAGAGPVAR